MAQSILLSDLTARFLTPAFASLIGAVRADIIAAEAEGREWTEVDLAAALDLPVPIARLLWAYQVAWTVQEQVRRATMQQTAAEVQQ